MSRPKIFSIAPHAPFLETLVAAIGDKSLPHPVPGLFGLADLTILVPTRRARTALADVLLERLGPALLLPDIRALGDADEAELPFLPPYEAGTLPAPVGPGERRLTLASLVDAWVRAGNGSAFNASGFASPPSPAEILGLADSLGSLIDACHTEGVLPSAFRALARDAELSAHWQQSLEFLDIALSTWPQILEERGKQDAARVRDLMLDRLTAAVPRLFGDRPVIAAGSTGSVPATARLLAAIANLPNGALVLPGFDTDLDEATQHALCDVVSAPHGAPQYGLARLLDHLGIAAGEVEELAPQPSPRTRLVRRALALAEATGHWSETRMSEAETGAALGGVAILAARSEDEEARAIACCAREAATGKTVGIITPDRNLARRIGAELRRFGVRVDDAAGTPLGQSRAGRLIGNALALIETKWAPVPLMALIRNRNLTLGRSRNDITRLADTLELGVLRGQRLASGAEGVRRGIAAALAGELDHPARKLDVDEAAELEDMIAALDSALAPLAQLHAAPGFDAAELATAVGAVFRSLTGAGSAEEVCPDGADVLDRWAAEHAGLKGQGPRFGGRHLGEGFAGLIAGLSVRAPKPETTGISILGLLEARLLPFDRVILAGLNEGVWPAAADPGPWLSRGMAIALGFEPEERRQGQAAHDFEMALGAPEVVLAYATRIGTAPALPSRLLQRLETFAGEDAGKAMRALGDAYLFEARALDAVASVMPASRPVPAPPASIRPRSLAVTDIEKLIRSPYELYAKYVLGLRPLEPLGADSGASERGKLLHAVMERMVRAGIDPRDPQARDRLIAEADAVFARRETDAARRAVLLRRLTVQASEVLDYEAARFDKVAERNVEVDGRMAFDVEGTEFILRGRADRIDEMVDGSFEIIDFKTGSVPLPKEMKQYLAPQLLAEALMLSRGGFKDLPAGKVSALTYLRLPADPAGFEEKPFVAPDETDLNEAAEALFVALQSRIAAYLLSDTQPLAPDLLPKTNRTYDGDYDHLSRRAEWAAAEDVEGDQ